MRRLTGISDVRDRLIAPGTTNCSTHRTGTEALEQFTRSDHFHNVLLYHGIFQQLAYCIGLACRIKRTSAKDIEWFTSLCNTRVDQRAGLHAITGYAAHWCAVVIAGN